MYTITPPIEIDLPNRIRINSFKDVTGLTDLCQRIYAFPNQLTAGEFGAISQRLPLVSEKLDLNYLQLLVQEHRLHGLALDCNCAVCHYQPVYAHTVEGPCQCPQCGGEKFLENMR